MFLKNFPPFKKNKKRNAQPDTDRQKSKQKMTLKPNTDNGLQGRTTEHQLPTAVLQKWRFSASYDSFVGKQTVVLRINIFGENRHLPLDLPNRYDTLIPQPKTYKFWLK